ncbi:MAG: hypothetical protein ACD_75C01236G0003 [uncultured bacterium]|nr:MAG: hypothetical protein ACD_75C01236G0003 [uncultured bacterium]
MSISTPASIFINIWMASVSSAIALLQQPPRFSAEQAEHIVPIPILSICRARASADSRSLAKDPAKVVGYESTAIAKVLHRQNVEDSAAVAPVDF